MKNVSNKEQFLKFQNQTSGWLNSSGALESPLTQRMIKATRRSASVFSSNLYGENNRVLCPSEPQLNAWMNRGGVSVMRSSDLSSLLAGSGNCASACGGSSCGNDDFDWKDMALMQMLPGLAQVAVAGIAKLFGLGGNTQAGGAQQGGQGIFPTNGNPQGGTVTGGGAVDGGGYTSAPSYTPAVTDTPAAGDKAPKADDDKAPKAAGDKGTADTAGTTPATTTSTSPLLGGADSAIDKCNKAKTKQDKTTELGKVNDYQEKFDTQINAKAAEIAEYDATIGEQNKILEAKRKEKADATSAYNKAKGAYDSQKTKTDTAKGKVDAQESKLAKANGELKSLTNAYNEAKAITESANTDYENAKAAYDTAAAQSPQPANLSQLKTAMENAASKLEKAKSREQVALEAKTGKEQQIGALEAEVERLKEDYNKQKTELDKCENTMKNAEKTIKGLENDTEYQAAIVARDKAMQGKAAAEAQKREFELKKAEVEGYVTQEQTRIANMPDENNPTA